MQQVYELHLISTGELIRRRESPYTLVRWHKAMERKLLRMSGTPERYKAAILAGDTIAGWANSTDYRRSGVTEDALRAEVKRIFRGYDKWFEDRAARLNEAVASQAAA